MLEITRLSKKYDQFALGPIDLHLEPGTAHGLIGPNGAGKTTLFRCIMGTVRRDQGLVKVKGNAANEASGNWKQHVGYVGDYTPLFEHWTGGRNLQAFATYYPTWSQESVQSLAARFDLNLSQVVRKYSTGQRTKLALILALAHNPDLLLLDEPANGLDPVARDVFMEVLYEHMQNEDLTLLYATHHVSEIEQLADQLVFLDAGRVVAQECTENLLQNWRKFTFRTENQIGEIPHEISRVNQGHEYEVTTSNFQSTLSFLEEMGVESIETSKLSTAQISVHILRNQIKEMNHD